MIRPTGASTHSTKSSNTAFLAVIPTYWILHSTLCFVCWGQMPTTTMASELQCYTWPVYTSCDRLFRLKE